MSIANQIKKRLAEIGMTQTELALKTQLTEACISMICTGARQPHVESLKLICAALRCSADYILQTGGSNVSCGRKVVVK